MGCTCTCPRPVCLAKQSKQRPPHAALHAPWGAPQGCTFLNQYVVVKTLGQGAYSRVKLALDTGDQRLVALKLLRRRPPRPALPTLLSGPGGPGAEEGPSQEARIMARLAHPNIVRLVEVIGAQPCPASRG